MKLLNYYVMVFPNYSVTEFKPIRNHVLNSLLLYMSIGSLPLLATSLFLFFSSGWKISMVTDTVGLISIPVIYLLRNKISYHLKTGYLIFMAYVTGILVLHDYSFFGTGLIILSSVTLISTLFFGMRTGWLMMAINIIGIAVIGFLYKINFLVYNFDFKSYIYSPITWFDHVVTFLFFIGIVVIAAGQIHSALLGLISQTRTEKEKFKGLFNNIQDAILIYSIDGKILEMNNSLLNMYGIERSSVFTAKAEDFAVISDSELVEKSGDHPNSKLQYESKAKRFDNQQEFYVEVMLSPIKYGEQKAILANIRDICQRRKAEESLKESEEKYRSVIESSPTGIFIVENSKFLYVNPAGAEKLGYNSDQYLIGRTIYSVLAPEFRKIAEQKLESTLQRLANLPVELKLYKADGTELWAEVVSIPFEYYGPQAVLIMGFDVTERKKAEELILQKNQEIENRNLEYALLNQKLKNAKEKAEESDRLKSAFLSNMSHEIRTPMNAILGFSDLLIKAAVSEKKRMEYIGIINSSGNQLLSLINDIIDISKIESNQIVIDNSTQINLNDIFKQLSVIFTSKTDNQKISLEYNIKLNRKESFVYMDEIRLKQILVNLIGNALKFTHNGFVRYSVAVEKKELLFKVDDSGIGIELKHQAVVFERFRQADGSTTRDYGGTGLGLAISKALVELMGGKIWLNSIPGEGTTFYFTLPYRPTGINVSEDNDNKEGVEKLMWNNRTLLIVEDEDINILLLTEFLRPTGVKILVAKNAGETFERIDSQEKIDLILMDIKIPEVNGYEITKIIKDCHPEIYVIAQTAYALAEERKNILNSRFDDYISKPINKTVLFNVLAKFFEKEKS